MPAKKQILCLASHYLPGFRAGGPVRSLLGMCQWLEDEFQFRVVTRDRDFGEAEPYPESLGQKLDQQWSPAGGAEVWYLARPYWLPWRLRKVIMDSRPDLLYLQSCLDPALAIMPMLLHRLGLLPRGLPVLVAPRGQFSPSALRLKWLKKVVFLWVARLLGLYRGVIWHATDENEARFLREWWGPKARVLVASNLPPRIEAPAGSSRPQKQPGSLRLVFLSRICPMKNLTGALASLAAVKSRVVLDIYGTREDPAYWAECETLIRRLPGNIAVKYCGVVEPEDVVGVLSGYDALFLPSLGENFGHVIIEALMAGCPVLLSDRTPWRDLAPRQVGLDVPLDKAGALAEAVETFAAMSEEELGQWSRSARQYGIEYCHNKELTRDVRQLLETAIHSSQDAAGGAVP